MEFTASPQDLFQAMDVVRKIDANPLNAVGRVMGLSAAEQRAGIPTWAWCTIAVGVGVAVGVKYAPQIREVFAR